MLYAIILLNNRKIDSPNVTSVFCCIKNWRRQLIGTKGRNLRKKSSSTISNFCVSLFQLCLFYFSPFLQESPLLFWLTLQRWIDLPSLKAKYATSVLGPVTIQWWSAFIEMLKADMKTHKKVHQHGCSKNCSNSRRMHNAVLLKMLWF